MFRRGKLCLSGKEYTTYELDLPGFRRLDICELDAEFQKEPQKVLYSEYTKRNTYRYGDPSLKDEMIKLEQKLRFAKLEEVIDSKWDDEGNFMEYSKSYRDDNFYMQHIRKDSESWTDIYKADGDSYIIQTVGRDYGAVREPLNVGNYTSSVINLENIAVKTAGSSPFIPLATLKKMHNLRHLDDKDYSYIHSVAEARKYLERCKEAAKEGKIVGYDIESTGLGMDQYGEDELVGAILSAYPGESRYFGFRHNNSYNLPIEFLEEFYDALIEIQEYLVAHNKKFDRKGATRIGKDLRVKHDSYLAAVLVNPVMKKGIHGLKHLEYERSHNKYLEFEDIFIDKSNINFADLPEDLIVAYACPDADNTRAVLLDQLAKLPKAEYKIYEIECELADLKSDQEYWGFRVDITELMKGQLICEKTLKMLLDAIRQITRRSDLNIDSPEVIADLLYTKMRCPVLMSTDSGRPSTSSKALEKLSKEKLDEPKDIIKHDIKNAAGATIIKASDLNAAKYPVVLFLVEYRKQLKLSTAFYNRIVRGAIDNTKVGVASCARYFSWVNQIVTSGRQSSPLHQLPKEIKKSILSDTPEHYLVDSDFSQIELRLMFSLAKEMALILKASDPSIDIHRAIQYVITHKEIWAISKEERSLGKSRNFGVIYLMSGRGLANNLYGAGATDDQVKICENAITEFYTALKRVKKFVAKNRQTVEKYGYMKTMLNRYKYFYEILDPEVSRERKARLIRQANNMPVQGTAADFMKIAENNIQNYIREKGWDKLVETSVGKYPLVRCMLSIHDETLVSAHRSIPVEEILEMIAECMELPVGNLFYRTPMKFSELSEDIEIVGIEKCDTDEAILQNTLAKNATHFNRQPFAPLFAASSVSDTWEEGHGGDFEFPRALRTRLLNSYHKTGKSVFDPWNKSYREVKFKDEEGNEVKTQKLVYDLKYQVLEKLNAFADESIDVYMEELIAKYGEDPSIVKDHVRHDVITHELIGRYSPSKEEEAEHGKYSHMELIEYATYKYFERRAGNVIDLSEHKAKKEEESINDVFTEIANLGESLVQVTPEGEYIYTEEYAEEEDNDIEVFDYDDEEKHIYDITSVKYNYCYEFGDKVLVDCMSIISQEDVNKVLALLFKNHKRDGFYPVYIAYANREINTGIRLEDVNTEEVTNFIQEIINSQEDEAVI